MIPLVKPTTCECFPHGSAMLYRSACFDWLASQPANSIHGVVTDPPYGLVEYNDTHKANLRKGHGGVWRIPPEFDGYKRSPLPRFTTLTDDDLESLDSFFHQWGTALLPVLVPGAHVLVASNPLVSSSIRLGPSLFHRVVHALESPRLPLPNQTAPEVRQRPRKGQARSGGQARGIFKKPIVRKAERLGI
jgi:hypothetical protein